LVVGNNEGIGVMAMSVGVSALVWWMLLLTLKHVVADFFLQNNWIATGKDARTGWALPLTVHCLIHGALTTLIIIPFAPKLWFLGLVDFAVHFVIDRTKGFIVSRYDVRPDHRWFWWLIGIDQALHHLTGFALAVMLAIHS
jgi:hypothetical protein